MASNLPFTDTHSHFIEPHLISLTFSLPRPRIDPQGSSSGSEVRGGGGIGSVEIDNDLPFNASPHTKSLELPPLHDPNIIKASGRPLLLEPDASSRSGKPPPSPSSHLPAQHSLTVAINEDEIIHPASILRKEAEKLNSAERALGGSSPQSLRRILDDDYRSSATTAAMKYQVSAVASKDDFVQLPQPPKKQIAAKQVVPPIINGLYEPPPQATLFPPIASSSFHDSHGRNSLNIVSPKVKELRRFSRDYSSDDPKKIVSLIKDGKKRRAIRPRKKWTDEETNNLLRGVHKHGVGNWTDILEDSSFTFNGRSGADLKDRFRTCCPSELREKSLKSTRQLKVSTRLPATSKSTSSLLQENILIEDAQIQKTTDKPDENSKTDRSSRAHRKNIGDLVQLGIDGPFRKSQRRERKPFSEEEDRHIKAGWEVHGAAWTRIQRDPRFHLQSRQPTDLRDRFRNKFPEEFRADHKWKESTFHSSVSSSSANASSLAKGNEHLSSSAFTSSNFQTMWQEYDSRAKDSHSREISLVVATQVQSSMSQALSNREGLRIQEMILTDGDSRRLSTLPPASSFAFKENLNFPESSIEAGDNIPFNQSFEGLVGWNGGVNSAIGEMDISRFLEHGEHDEHDEQDEHEGWSEMPDSHEKEKPNVPYFSNLLAEADVDMHDVPTTSW